MRISFPRRSAGPVRARLYGVIFFYSLRCRCAVVLFSELPLVPLPGSDSDAAYFLVPPGGQQALPSLFFF